MERKPSQLQYSVQRTAFDVEDLRDKASYSVPSKKSVPTLGECCEKINLRQAFLSAVPICQWLPTYKWDRDFASDLIAGFTVAVMHIPQGMAYGILANLDPIVGIYMGFFPVFIYALFGTSRHLSVGTFAVVSIMTAQVIKEQTGKNSAYSNIDVATALAMNIALILLVMYVLRLGAITSLLSDTMVNAFICGASFHILAAQIQDMFGLHLPPRPDICRVIYTFVDLCRDLPKTNLVTFVISSTFFAILVIYIELIKPRSSEKTTIPFPIELICILLGTAVSSLMELNKKYHVDNVGTVPTGLPNFKVPSFELMPQIVFESFTIALVAYTVNVSMSLMFAQKRTYQIRPNQELLALCSNARSATAHRSHGSLSKNRLVFEHGLLRSGLSFIFVLSLSLYQLTFHQAKEIEGIKIFGYHGTLIFLTKDTFKDTLISKTGLNPYSIMDRRVQYGDVVPNDTVGVKCIIIDFSGISCIDPSGASTLVSLVSSFMQIGITVFLSGCTDNVVEDFIKCEKYDSKRINFVIFPTVHDAVLCAEANFLK
ncbi:hypothetical protein FQA39_LY15830 [Lamprigera yunnana]|nr:hypothetical protein FQA39_LY15830 [Lamprigera yunnana]